MELIMDLITLVSLLTVFLLTFIDLSAKIGECVLKKNKRMVNTDTGCFLFVMVYLRDSIEESLSNMVEGVLKYGV